MMPTDILVIYFPIGEEHRWFLIRRFMLAVESNDAAVREGMFIEISRCECCGRSMSDRLVVAG